MSDRGGVSPWAFVPGLPRILGGRWVSGGYVLLVWIALLWVLVARWDRVMTAPGGPLDHRIALATLILGLVGIWWWSFRAARWEGDEPDPGAPGGSRIGLFRAGLARSFRGNRIAAAGAGAVIAFYLVALLAPLLAPYDPTLQGDLVRMRLEAPSGAHLLGTDQFARDILSRIVYGARVSLSIGLLAVGIAVTLGTVVGAVAGYLGGRVDGLIMRFVDMVISFPRLVLLITIIALFEPSILLIVVVLGLTQWPFTARIVRAEILSLREREFIQAGTALGFSRTRIIFRHLIPNCLGPVIVAATLGIGDAIILEAGLSFLGLGVQPPTPSWGTMVADGRGQLMGAWWLSTFPGFAIVLTVLAFNLAGDGFRDYFDPRLRG
jgi:peptide/nickel transport system permease protein